MNTRDINPDNAAEGGAMNEPIPVPTSIACAYCGKPLVGIHSFGLSVPELSRVKPSDFCDLGCLADWIEWLPAIGGGT